MSHDLPKKLDPRTPAGEGPASVRIALVQMTCTPEKEPNVAKAIERIEHAAEAGAQIVCLQELFAGQYPCQSEDHARFAEAEPIPGPTSERLVAAAKRCKVAVVGSLFERRAAGLYHNTAVIIAPDGTLAGMYRKMHIPDDPLYYEKFYFTPGDLGFRSFDTPFGRLGVCVCWDQWYPEAARLTALAMLASTGFVLAHFALAKPLAALDVPASIHGLSLAMAVFSTVLPTWLVAEAIGRLGASRTSLVGSLGPVFTIALGAAILGEALAPVQLAGAALVLAGVALVSARPRAAAPR